MEKLLAQCSTCILIGLALVLMYTAAEREYFIQNKTLSWNDARNYCQICFEELVTLTPDNIQLITEMLDSEHWIGLRENFPSNNSWPWSRWANGDPLLFQNWYLGRPVLKSPRPKMDCCSCSCKCTTNASTEQMNSTSGTGSETGLNSFYGIFDDNVTNSSSYWESLIMNSNASYTTCPSPLRIEAACERSPIPETNETDGYIEDPCVAMLSFGPWVEKSCSDPLPFICYEDRFFGTLNVTNVTSESATLSWQPEPDDITYYHVEVTDDEEEVYNSTNSTYDLVDLIPGGHYKVQVFPVKCERKLNPLNATFYTEPNKVKDLTAVNETETSVTLSWTKPEGKLNFYLIKTGTREIKQKAENQTVLVDSLIPGSLYTFTVLTGVQDESRWSEESNITTYTKPGKVSNLKASDNTNESVQLNWTAPEGSFTGFRVKAVDIINLTELCCKETVERGMLVEQLPSSSKIRLSVTTLLNNPTPPDHTAMPLEGDEETIITYTAPGPISNLKATTDQSWFNARWSPPEGNYSSFNVTLTLDGKPDFKENLNSSETQAMFGGLQSAAKYTVAVSAVIEGFEGPTVTVSEFTRPSPPTNVEVILRNSSSITFHWERAGNVEIAKYRVKLSSSLWNYTTSEDISDTQHTFFNLKSGSRYNFTVSTLAGNSESPPVYCNSSTDAKKVEITLSMLCCSVQPLLCDKATSREKVMMQLMNYFNNTLGKDLFWVFPEQEKQTT